MINNLYEEQSYVLVFGHTHEVDEYCSDAGTIKMYNTGGWLVEKYNEEPRVYPAIFLADNENCRLLPFAVHDDEIRKAGERAVNTEP